MGTGLGTRGEWRGRWHRGIGDIWIWPTRSLLFDFAVYFSWHAVD